MSLTTAAFDLAYWINERYAMKLRKETPGFQLLPFGYSANSAMGTVRYCNVHREDDKVTKWIRQHWNRADDPVWKFVLGRMVNLPETLEGMLYTRRLQDMKDQMISLRSMGEKVWTAAYTISTCGRQMDKIDYVFDHVIAKVAYEEDSYWPVYTSCHDTWKDLQAIDGLGSFLAAQVVADMKNTPGHPLAAASDFWTFSAPGPGSLRGLSWFFYDGPDGVTAATYAHHLKRCREEVDPLVLSYVPRTSDQDFQNCLCEFSKYMKVKTLNGRIRNRYIARSQS